MKKNDKNKNIGLIAGGLILIFLVAVLVFFANKDNSKSSAAKNESLNELNLPQLSTAVADDEAEVKMVTEAGDITIKLFPKYAPLASQNFLTHAKDGYYNNLEFFRVVKDFMIQSGDPENSGRGGQSIWKDKDKNIDSGQGFKNEISQNLYHIRGALSMANAGANTNGSQFFIVQNPVDSSAGLNTGKYPSKIIDSYKTGGVPSLDGNYTVFGQVISGMDVVDKIASGEVATNDSGEKSKPLNPVKIKSIEIIKDYDFSK
ncbi:peptidylprolyl isomerase [Streptococcaceae bacterium ESL0729]|nr:peptidylprolyl isomerase [Streptococcaceae bacterium ESL0729]